MGVDSYRLEGARELIRDLEKTYPNLVKKTIDKEYRKTGVRVKREIRNQWLPYRKTGRLDRSIGWGLGNKGGKSTHQTLSNYSIAPHALFRENDTRPHYIFPRIKSVLRFMVNGKWVFAKYVLHPGTRGDPAFRDAERRRYLGLPVRIMNLILAELHRRGL